MGGSAIEDEWELTMPSSEPRTIVLVGKTGNGKSATGNTILGERVFKSRTSSSGVTSSCELQTTVLGHGQIVSVIDTPGLFDASIGSDFIGKEIVKCINMAKDGIHAVILVLTVRNRFSEEEGAAIRSLQSLFGTKIVNYMVVVFTGGDDLEENDETLDDYLGRDCPQSLKEIMQLCNNRVVLFDNKTKDELKRVEQVKQLMTLVDSVISQNDGKPYTDDIFIEMQKAKILRDKKHEVNAQNLKGASDQELVNLTAEMNKAYDEQLKRITQMVEEKLRETTSRLEQQLAEEQAARLRAEEVAQMAQLQSNDEIRKLRENLERAQKETEELRKKAEKVCTIL